MRYREDGGQFADATLDRAAVDDVVAGLPVRKFRSCEGRQHYSGWYWSSTLGRLVVDESRLKLARIMLADFDPSSVTPGGTGRVVLCPPVQQVQLNPGLDRHPRARRTDNPAAPDQRTLSLLNAPTLSGPALQPLAGRRQGSYA